MSIEKGRVEIAKHTCSSGLDDKEIEDAVQEAVKWLLEAAGRYNRKQRQKAPERPFRSLLCLVVPTRLIDFMRRVQCRKKHFRCSLRLAALRDPAADGAGRPRRPPQRPGEIALDPSLVLEKQELRTCLQQALEHFDGRERRALDAFAAGASKGRVAQMLGVSLSWVKRLRKRARLGLRRHLPAGIWA